MPMRVNVGDAREILRRVQDILAARPDLGTRYETAKQVVRAFRKPAFYEVSHRCNLRCEGCYYFESGRPEPPRETHSASAWGEFFAAEADRHVTMAYFVGAEPALEQERLFAAAPYFPYGNIGTNGTIRIDPAIPYRIGVSVWAGDDATDRTLRGASAFGKAFRNYAGDPRAIILYTLSAWNLESVRRVAEMCRDHDLPLTFNMYSPTATFLNKLKIGIGNDDEFYRVSHPGHSPCFSPADLVRVRRLVADLIDEFPETIVYTKAYNGWITEPGPRYELSGEAGVALRCGSRMVGNMKYFGTDLRETPAKCGTPDVDCAQCRMYSGGWSSKFQPGARDVASAAAFSEWLEMMQALGKIFLYERGEPQTAALMAAQ